MDCRQTELRNAGHRFTESCLNLSYVLDMNAEFSKIDFICSCTRLVLMSKSSFFLVPPHFVCSDDSTGWFSDCQRGEMAWNNCSITLVHINSFLDLKKNGVSSRISRPLFMRKLCDACVYACSRPNFRRNALYICNFFSFWPAPDSLKFH